MTYRQILYAIDEGVATITLNRPDRLNAWTPTMAAEVRAAMDAAQSDPAARVVILTGAGRGFCAGVDMDELQAIGADGAQQASAFTPPDVTARPDFHHPQTWFPAIRKPILAVVNGPCAGMGFAISLFCDLRFAADSAIFVSAFARRGLIAEHGTSWMLSRLVGHSRAMDIMLSSRRVSAEEAGRIGLVDRVAPAERLMEEARAYALELAQFVSPRSMAVIKRQLWNALLQDLREAMSDADRDMAASLTTDDFKEGVAHFVEKRPPRFPGLS